MKVIFSPRRERVLTVFKASISVIVKFVCVCVCVSLLIGACGRRCHCLCVNVYLACWAIVGKQSENPRSCWKEMIGFRTWWALCDRWLGAGLAEPKSPTHTYVDQYKPTHTHIFRTAFKMPTHTCLHVKLCEKGVWSLCMYICRNKNTQTNLEHFMCIKGLKKKMHIHRAMLLNREGNEQTHSLTVRQMHRQTFRQTGMNLGNGMKTICAPTSASVLVLLGVCSLGLNTIKLCCVSL